jgi:hypothetical protein
MFHLAFKDFANGKWRFQYQKLARRSCGGFELSGGYFDQTSEIVFFILASMISIALYFFF